MGRIQNEFKTKGIYLNYGNLNKEKALGPVISIRDISTGYLMGNARLNEVNIHPDIVSSLLSFKPSMRVNMRNCVIFIGEEEAGSFEKGDFILRLLPGKLFIQDVSFEGEITASGNIVFDASAGRIASASVDFKVPEKMEVFIKALSRNKMFNKTKTGEWQFILEK